MMMIISLYHPPWLRKHQAAPCHHPMLKAFTTYQRLFLIQEKGVNRHEIGSVRVTILVIS